MMIASLFIFLITVSLGRSESGCLERYQSCGERVSKMKGEPPCRIISTMMKCLVDTTEICFPQARDTVAKYQLLFQEGCRPGSPFFQNVAQTLQCLSQDSGPFEECELEGEFENVAEICSSLSSLISCAQVRTEVVCGPTSANVFQKFMRPIQDLLGDCKNSQDAEDTEVQPCYRGLLKCDRRILTSAGHSCHELEELADCYMDVAKRDCGLNDEEIVMKLARKYVEQIPDYCNPKSRFSQSLEKSRTCIFIKIGDLQPCNVKYQKILSKVSEGVYDTDESLLVMARASVEYRDCSAEKLGTACGEDAAVVTRFVLQPLADVADDTCKDQTGEKCSGAVTVKCTILLLILCITYILMKED